MEEFKADKMQAAPANQGMTYSDHIHKRPCLHYVVAGVVVRLVNAVQRLLKPGIKKINGVREARTLDLRITQKL
ncbi:hypothetical protein ACJIZ3_025515 [Penstemon smallii]|uniref:Uncharacterized protein n=1 Tax=Penstemon smallii TaxID=265156 RepID=A0ABD3TUS6_9LAMI